MAPHETLKRKEPPAAAFTGQTRVKRVKAVEARQIRTEPSHKALNERKELDVGSFVKSHDFEIRALEQSLTSAKSALTQRAFQQVPRQLRRRTASHNVKRVPKRLRARAAREMREDKTPTAASQRKGVTGKQRLRNDIAVNKKKAGASNPTRLAPESQAIRLADGLPEIVKAPILHAKYKKRQLNKAWLPTHIYHAKRAQMTPPLEPLWKFAIPITPTEKSFRLTHRAWALRGCVAWDISYMSTIQLSGTELSLLKALNKLSVHHENNTSDASKWKLGIQAWTGWLHECSEAKEPMTPATIIWSPAREHDKMRKLIIRVHPASFPILSKEIMRVSRMQRPMIDVRDMRYELGSIEIAGPAATEAITRIVRPLHPKPGMFETWDALATVTNLDSLPRNPVLSFLMRDPRLNRTSTFKQSEQSDERLLQFLSTWPPASDREPFPLLDDQQRKISQKQKLSQKSIDKLNLQNTAGNQLRDAASQPGIPVILYATQSEQVGGTGDSWMLMLPWEHVSPTWHTLMNTSLLGGGQPRMGGLREQRQKAFESAIPWFPGDFPCTAAGWAWELSEREKRKREWEKRPKSKRTSFQNLDLGYEQKGELGLGWACDWEYLLGLEQMDGESCLESDLKETLGSTAGKTAIQKPRHSLSCIPKEPSPIKSNQLAVVSINFTGRGHASPCARIYCLPSAPSQRRAWLELAPTMLHRGTATRQKPRSRSQQTPSDEEDIDQALKVPPPEDLVGFVTTGNYNLGEGRTTAIGNLRLQKMLAAGEFTQRGNTVHGWCIVRNAGDSIPRLARWKHRSVAFTGP